MPMASTVAHTSQGWIPSWRPSPQADPAESSTLKMIPSENFAQFAVLEATGSILTNKYCEGYPGARYYEGNEIVDEIEHLAIERAKALFGAEHANVQPYSGSPANQAAYRALADPGCKVMGMPVPAGGHLTHGWGVNFSGSDYVQVPYGPKSETGMLDYDEIRDIARRERPRMIWVGGTSYPRVFDYDEVRRDRRRGRRLSGGRHRPHQRPDRGRRSSRSGSVLRRRDQHEPQDAPRAAGRLHPLEDRGPLPAEVPRREQAEPGQADRSGRVSRPPGRPAHARDRRHGRHLQGGRHRGVPRVRPAGRAKLPAVGREALGARLPAGQRRHRQSSPGHGLPRRTRTAASRSPRPWPRRGSSAISTWCPAIPASRSSPAACGWARRP